MQGWSRLLPPDHFENMDDKMEHSNAIWNANLELQWLVKSKIEHSCILSLFEKIEIKDSEGCILTVFESIGNCREKNINRDAKWCILMAFETILNDREDF